MPVSSQARHVKISSEILSEAIGKRHQNEGYGPNLLHSRRLDNLMAAANNCKINGSPLLCRTIRRLSLAPEKISDEGNTPRKQTNKSLSNIGRPQSSSVVRGNTHRRHSTAEPIDLKMCALGSALGTREIPKFDHSPRPPRSWSAGTARGVHYSQPVSFMATAILAEDGVRSSPSNRLRVPLLPLTSEQARASSGRRANALLFLRARTVPMALSTRHATPPQPPALQSDAAANARGFSARGPSQPASLQLDFDTPPPLADYGPAAAVEELGAVDGAGFDYVSLIIE